MEAEEVATKRPVQNIRIKTPASSTEAAVDYDEEVAVEKITNSDRDIIEAVLDQAEAEDKTPFSGLSEVRTLTQPSGLRSSNEQVRRVTTSCGMLM